MITEKAWKVLEAAREYREAVQRFFDEPASEHSTLDVMEALRALKAAAMEMGDE